MLGEVVADRGQFVGRREVAAVLEVAVELRRHHHAESLRAVLFLQPNSGGVRLAAGPAPVRGELQPRHAARHVDLRGALGRVQPAGASMAARGLADQFVALDRRRQALGDAVHALEFHRRAAQQVEGLRGLLLPGPGLGQVRVGRDNRVRELRGPLVRRQRRVQFDQARRVLDDAGVDVVGAVVAVQDAVRLDTLPDEASRAASRARPPTPRPGPARRAGGSDAPGCARPWRASRPSRPRPRLERRARGRWSAWRRPVCCASTWSSARAARSAAARSPAANCAAHADAYAAALAPTALTSSCVVGLPLSFSLAWRSFIRAWRYSRADARHPAGVAGIEGGAGACAATATANATTASRAADNGFFMSSLRCEAPALAGSAGRDTADSCSIHP